MGSRVGSQLERDQVGLGQDADQVTVVHHRHGADAMGDKDLGGLLERHARRHRDHRTGHDVPDSHPDLLASVAASLA
jgi:hypothetical protein